MLKNFVVLVRTYSDSSVDYLLSRTPPQEDDFVAESAVDFCSYELSGSADQDETQMLRKILQERGIPEDTVYLEDAMDVPDCLVQLKDWNGNLEENGISWSDLLELDGSKS